MKSQLAFGLFALSTVSLLLSSATAAQAGLSLNETTDFTRQRPSQVIRTRLGSNMMNGMLKGKDDRSDWIRIGSASQVKQIKLNLIGNGLNRSLYQDNNRNGRSDAGDKLIPFNGNEVALDASKQYLLAITRSTPNSTAARSYIVQLTGFKETSRYETVKVSILRAKALSRFDTKVPGLKSYKADFEAFLKMDIEGSHASDKTRLFKNNDDPRFNHTYTSRVRTTQKRIPIELSLRDRDGDVFAGGAHDQADISPTRDRRLQLSYEPSTGKVFGPTGRVIGKRNQQITVTGNSRKDNASITFKIH
ncbi:hypothetical protein IQ266_06055 [filamentous cyanobacterium LEGE 11480]|uniref:C2 domain-containing protein n=1 Tax=Romeriopsis navalis LEGE 11480 TaxID=2777977 RepID=A0A928VJ75_9CYAN|nr:C2 domain-containing protein [Romeriopsis navalis]MBE9029325.1 hypothetical protein [Romeriopsis navalis LEGE 11480]